jgi:hypothetical protein
MRRGIIRPHPWLLRHVARSGTITFTGGEYDTAGRVRHYGSDANTLYFTPSVSPRGNYKQAKFSCPYSLIGDTLILRDCPASITDNPARGADHYRSSNQNHLFTIPKM